LSSADIRVSGLLGDDSPHKCRERISLGDGDTKDARMLKESGYCRAAGEGRVGRVAMSGPGTDFNSMIFGVA